MAGTARVERVDLLEARERHGTAVRVVLRSRVVGLTDTTYATLFTALAVSGIPSVGSLLAGAPHLTLAERNPKLVNKGTVDVDLVYEPFNDEGQNMDNPPNSVMTGVLRASVSQVTTNLDKDGEAVSLTHTWPSDDPDHPGRTDVQGGEFQVFVPQKTFVVQGIKTSSRPWVISNKIIGSVNNGFFAGERAHEWLCTSAGWEIVDASSPNRYHMTFEFQHNPDTWNPQVVFIDNRTGKPPVDLVEGDGFKTVRVHDEENFESIIGTRIQGA